MVFPGMGRVVVYTKGGLGGARRQGTIRISIENIGNNRTKGFYQVKLRGSSECE